MTMVGNKRSKMIFFDTTNSGHHFLYNCNVLEGFDISGESYVYLSKLNKDQQRQLALKKITYKVLDTKSTNVRLHDLELIIKMFFYMLKSRIKKVHFLYLDSIFPQLLILLPILLLFRLQVTGTLHWYPKQMYKIKIMNFMINLGIIKNIIVHGEYTKDKLIKEFKGLNNDNVTSIQYPYIHNDNEKSGYEPPLQKLGSVPHILLFGGLRHDKGLDILLEAASIIKEKQFILLIIGKEEYFKQNDVRSYIDFYNLKDKVYLEIGYVPDEMVSSYFNMSDIVVLPYRKVFAGQSGPLTEGAAKSKVIIGPNHGEIGHTISKYNLGLTFKTENVNDLAQKLRYCIDHLEEIKTNIRPGLDNYQNLIKVSRFKKAYYSVLANNH
ncbi:hypothetical protein AS030_17550 [Fictibacillus enclensis]|uniref:Glycosyl transferase family 1 domain-containing protein n=1 Tax=Fictibacillus enclensis TaxID=1017270 RepID=A0A0V8J4T5_9BACL|nr:glycosyltransferase [Fictibacillus enclensis]KSU82076.1 hypothetical protein AS030_17550 [Fictibacillus enclensis]